MTSVNNFYHRKNNNQHNYKENDENNSKNTLDDVVTHVSKERNKER